MSQPQDFNIFKIYSKVAEDLQNSNPIISYYLKTFTLNKALEYLKNERSQGKDVSDRTQEIKVWLQDLENLKVGLDSQLSDKEHCKQLFKDFTQNMFQKSDYDYRNANYSRPLARDFLYVSVLFDAWELLGAQTEETKDKKNYSNQARFKIMEALANGIKPMPIPQPNNMHLQPNNMHPQPVSNQNHNQGQPSQPPIQEKKQPENVVKHEESVDPMAKINFALTESIVVPQTSIDKFLNSNGKKTETKPVSDINHNVTQLNPHGNLNLRVGKSVALDEKNPGINPPFDQHTHPITQQKTPPTVFYAPRQNPNPQQQAFHQNPPVNNAQPHPEAIIENSAPGKTSTLYTGFTLETPGEPSEDHDETLEETSQRHSEAKIEPLHAETKIQPLPETLQNLSTIKIQQTAQNHHQGPVVENHQQQQAHPSSVFQNHESHHIPSVIHNSHVSSQHLQNIPNSAILENAKPATSIFTSNHPEIQPQHLESIKLDVENKSLFQEKPENLSIYQHQHQHQQDSQLPSNPQSVFNQHPNASVFQSKISELAAQSKILNLDSNVKTLENENLYPNQNQCQAQDFTFAKTSQIDKVVQCKGVKDICLKAIIDLNTTNVQEAKLKLQQALQLLNEIE